MRAWIKELLRRLKVTFALRFATEYPRSLPNPMFASRDKKRQRVVDGLKTVAVFLGPYRNLTTLSAAFLFLHPECQVLNHAGTRILENENLNFFVNYSDRKFQDFCQRAILMSQGGTRGSYGGSIVLSHAFAKHQAMRRAYRYRYGTKLLKKKIHCLVWKESFRVTKLLQEQNTDFDDLFAKNSQLRFILPIRNPIDCANSITRTGLRRNYGDLGSEDSLKVMDINLDAMGWFLELQARHPDRFFHFYQDQLGASVLEELAMFLGLSQDKRWIRDTLDIYKLRPPYDYEPSVISHYDRRIAEVFAGKPEVVTRFMELITPQQG